ncbi:hypothetical protein MTBBW1_2470005 [Desulfamplus magnetovallimortis]|uniref:Uncharacterized protein n=1 Tax=Desulfamplus magnetovallimortis TaxID=1246637 RepID=A0A1W1HEK2_9BACT|nr:hypothetical protein MTBBW1_2470005 [Desulfamplus magnetovallimortis]
MLEKIITGNIGPATKVVDQFMMPDERMLCLHFDKFTSMSNDGCPYQCGNKMLA